MKTKLHQALIILILRSEDLFTTATYSDEEFDEFMEARNDVIEALQDHETKDFNFKTKVTQFLREEMPIPAKLRAVRWLQRKFAFGEIEVWFGIPASNATLQTVLRAKFVNRNYQSAIGLIRDLDPDWEEKIRKSN